MKLLNSFGPNPRAVRMYMLEKGIEMPFEDLDLLGGDNRAEAYLKKNPGGQMPSLELRTLASSHLKQRGLVECVL